MSNTNKVRIMTKRNANGNSSVIAYAKNATLSQDRAVFDCSTFPNNGFAKSTTGLMTRSLTCTVYEVNEEVKEAFDANEICLIEIYDNEQKTFEGLMQVSSLKKSIKVNDLINTEISFVETEL